MELLRFVDVRWLCNRYAFCRIACVHRRASAVLTSIRWQSTDRLASIRLVDWVIIYNRSKKWFYFRCSIMTYSTSLIWHRHEVSFSMDNLVSFLIESDDMKLILRHWQDIGSSCISERMQSWRQKGRFFSINEFEPFVVGFVFHATRSRCSK